MGWDDIFVITVNAKNQTSNPEMNLTSRGKMQRVPNRMVTVSVWVAVVELQQRKTNAQTTTPQPFVFISLSLYAKRLGVVPTKSLPNIPLQKQ